MSVAPSKSRREVALEVELRWCAEALDLAARRLTDTAPAIAELARERATRARTALKEPNHG